MKRLSMLLVLAMVLTLSACSNTESNEETTTATPTTETTANVETFGAEYEMVGTTSSGAPKNDTFIFNGETTDGIITSLEFDVIRNKGLDTEYSKTEINGYEMNVSDVVVAKTDDGFALTEFTSKGYSEDFADGGRQFLQNASIENLTDETTFKELTITDYTGTELSLEDALISYAGVAKEAGVELTEDTLVKDLITVHGAHDGTTFVEVDTRISFEGINGGRSYGEQIQAIEDYILANNMTLEDVLVMFQTENQSSSAIMDRDTVAGATITFVGDFQRMMHYVIDGEIFQGVVNTTTNDDGSYKFEVVTQGYAGEIETNVTIDAEGNVIAIDVRDANETPTYGGVLTAEGSEFIASLLENQADLSAVDTVTGSTATANALLNAVNYALEAYAAK